MSDIVKISFLLVISLCMVQCFIPKMLSLKRYSSLIFNAIPLELEGKLDSNNKWEVKFVLNGEEKVATVSEGDSLLESAEKLFDYVPSSCRNGVCTTCAAKIVDGKDSTKLAVHGLGEPQINAGFVCSCQCFPIGPGVTVELDAYDEVYDSPYGQYEKSYEMKYGEREDGEKKKKGCFGF